MACSIGVTYSKWKGDRILGDAENNLPIAAWGSPPARLTFKHTYITSDAAVIYVYYYYHYNIPIFQSKEMSQRTIVSCYVHGYAAGIS